MIIIKKIIIAAIAAIIILTALMYAEYRFIMCNLCPYTGDNGIVYVEFIGQVDEYYVEPASEL